MIWEARGTERGKRDKAGEGKDTEIKSRSEDDGGEGRDREPRKGWKREASREKLRRCWQGMEEGRMR